MLAKTRHQGLRRAAAVLGLALLVIAGWLGWHAVTGPAGKPTAIVKQPLDPGPAPSVLVFVSGAVVNPGLYRLSPDARIADALAAAGGLVTEADLGRLPDMASRIHDGKQVNVPFARGGRGSGGAAASKLDVNSASLDELRAVPGMPAGMAEAIVEHRDRFGPVASLTDLRDALTIDRAEMTALGHYLTVVVP